ncbi:MAG: hypothetical protein NT024_08125 [Proteobacteria bacterium]|nr:hypothetical protein [Pseudomonadota bacterium]
MLEWDAERLRSALFGAQREDRPGLKEVRLNRCPFVAPLEALRPQDAQRLELDVPAVLRRFEVLRSNGDLGAKVAAIYGDGATDVSHDADSALYDGFINDSDRAICSDVVGRLLEGVASPDAVFSDERLNELLFRLRARRDESSLSAPERSRWRQWLKRKLIDGGDASMTLQKFRLTLDRLEGPADLIVALRQHADAIERILEDVGAA